jgi:hypothetical protein
MLAGLLLDMIPPQAEKPTDWKEVSTAFHTGGFAPSHWADIHAISKVA